MHQALTSLYPTRLAPTKSYDIVSSEENLGQVGSQTDIALHTVIPFAAMPLTGSKDRNNHIGAVTLGSQLEYLIAMALSCRSCRHPPEHGILRAEEMPRICRR